jgi:arylsulfatase A-like enzyme
MADKPNILLIILDTLRRDRLSVYGHSRETSPAFDAFAAAATLFERAVAAAQWTIPSHTSMFTGLYPSTHQITQADNRLSGSYATLAEILNMGGYETAGFCNNPLVGVLDNGLQRGFEHFFNYAGAAPNRPFDTARGPVRRMVSTRFYRFARRVSNQFAQSDMLFRVSLHPAVVPLWTRFVNYKGHTGHSVDDLIDYLKRHRADGQERPLFAFLNLMGAHLPYHPPPAAVDRVAPEIRRDKQAYAFMRRFNSEAARWASPAVPPLSDWERQVIDHFYDAEIARQDDHLGRLLRYLGDSGALDDTLVIIAADHGEGHGDHDFFGHSFVVYQELVHVPLVIRYPERFPAGKRITTNISTRRIFHTVLDIAGIKPPLDETDPNADVSGLSLARAVNGQRDTEGDIAFAEAFPPQTFLNVLKHRNPAVIQALNLTHIRRGVYDGEHKLTVVADRVEGLFNVAADPGETHNVADLHPDLAQTLQQKLASFVTTVEQFRPDGSGLAGMSDAVTENLRALGYFG